MDPPPPGTGIAIPFLGETRTYEFIIDIAAQGDLFLNVAGNWIGRRSEDSSQDDARHYIRPKVFRTGQEMRQIQLGLPGAVGGSAVNVPQPKKATSLPPSSGAAPGTTFPNVSGKNPGNGIDEDMTGNTQIPDLPGLPNKPFKITQNKKSDEPATGINLSGCFEKWGLSADKTLECATIEFNGLTTQQVKQILQRIPSTFKASLEVSFQEGEDA